MPFEKPQLMSGPKRVGRRSYLRPPPKPPIQKTFRAEPHEFEELEERAMEETVRLGVNVSMSSLIRRGMRMVLETPLPPHSREPKIPCLFVETGFPGEYIKCLTCNHTKTLTDGTTKCHDIHSIVTVAI